MRKWLPLIAICLGTFMLLIDVTIVNVALPDMAIDLKTSFSSLQWVVDAYALALAALLLGVGSLSDILGHRRMYIGGLGLFALASLACGLSPNAGLLIGARAVQGVGAAAMFATTFALLNSSYTGRDRGTAYGMWGAVSGAAAAVGPILGGLLTEGISWRWIFFVNLPISVAAVALTLAVVAGNRPAGGRRLDVPGTVTFTVAAAAVTFAMIRSTDDGWSSPSVLGLVALGVVALVAFVVIQNRSDHELLDMGLFRSPTFVAAMLAGLFLTFSAFSAFTYTSVWLQSLLRLSPIEAGLTGLPLSAAAFVVSAVIGRFLHGRNPGPIIGSGMLLIGAGSLLCGLLIKTDSSWLALLPGFVVIGLGVGLATPTLSSTAMGAVPVQRGGMAAGAVNTARQLGFAFGIALLGSVFAAQAQRTLTDRQVPDPAGTSHALAGGQAQQILARVPAANRAQVSSDFHAAFASGLDTAFLIAGIGGLVVGLVVLVLARGAGAPAQPARPAPAPGASTVGSSAEAPAGTQA